MPLRIKSITFVSTDFYRLAQVLSQLTEFVEDADNGNPPDPEALLLSPDGRLGLLFNAVPGRKEVKNRGHLNPVPLDRRAGYAR